MSTVLRIDATLLGGGDVLTYEDGKIISQCYTPGKVVGIVRDDTPKRIVEGFLLLFDTKHCSVDINPDLYFSSWDTLNKLVEWLP